MERREKGGLETGELGMKGILEGDVEKAMELGLEAVEGLTGNMSGGVIDMLKMEEEWTVSSKE